MHRAQRGTCAQITEALKEGPLAEMFLDPVDAAEEDMADYYDVIQSPMCLQTVSDNLKANRYAGVKQWLDDVLLVFNNCIEYYGAGSAQACIAEHMKLRLQKLVKNSMWGYDDWFDKVLHSYSTLVERFSNGPDEVKQAIRSEEQGAVCLTEEQYKALAEQLGVVKDQDEVFSLCYLMELCGTKVPVKSKRGKVNLRQISPATVHALWKFTEERNAKGK